MLDLFGITFYGYGLLIGIGIWLAMEIALKNRGSIPLKQIERVMWWAVISGVVGARIYHVIDYWSRYYSANLIKIFAFWEGGLGIWGAVAGGIIGVSLYCYFNKLKILHFFDALVVGVPLAQAIGRIGNFVNDELMGKNGEPLWFYESILDLMLFGTLWKISRKKWRSGTIFGFYLIGYGVIRIGLENIRVEQSIWRLGNIPVAVIMGIIAVLCGFFLTFRKKQS